MFAAHVVSRLRVNHGGKLAGARVYRAVWERRTVEEGEKRAGGMVGGKAVRKGYARG